MKIEFMLRNNFSLSVTKFKFLIKIKVLELKMDLEFNKFKEKLMILPNLKGFVFIYQGSWSPYGTNSLLFFQTQN